MEKIQWTSHSHDTFFGPKDESSILYEERRKKISKVPGIGTLHDVYTEQIKNIQTNDPIKNKIEIHKFLYLIHEKLMERKHISEHTNYRSPRITLGMLIYTTGIGQPLLWY